MHSYLIHNVVLISVVQQSDSVTHISTLFYILLSYGLSWDIEHSSLCHTAGLCCLSILFVIICLYWPQTPNPSLSRSTPPWQPRVCSLCLWVCFIDRFTVPYIKFCIELISYGICLFLLHLVWFSSCIHVAANNIISFSFFLMYKCAQFFQQIIPKILVK